MPRPLEQRGTDSGRWGEILTIRSAFAMHTHSEHQAPFERAIGRLAMNFGPIETAVTRLHVAIGAGKGMGDPSAVSRSLGRRIEEIRDRIPQLEIPVPLVSELMAALDETIAIADERGRIVHVEWLDPEGVNIDAIKIRTYRTQSGSWAEEQMTPDAILRLANRVHEAWNLLRETSRRVRAVVHENALVTLTPKAARFVVEPARSNSTLVQVTRVFPDKLGHEE